MSFASEFTAPKAAPIAARSKTSASGVMCQRVTLEHLRNGLRRGAELRLGFFARHERRYLTNRVFCTTAANVIAPKLHYACMGPRPDRSAGRDVCDDRVRDEKRWLGLIAPAKENQACSLPHGSIVILQQRVYPQLMRDFAEPLCATDFG